MAILDSIRIEYRAARINKDKKKIALLSTLIGDADKIGKDDGNRKTTDAETIAVIKKFIKNVDETLVHMTRGSHSWNDLIEEKRILENLLPYQLTEEELRTQISHFVFNSNKGVNMGLVMKWLKEHFEGQYDGKMASDIVKEVLSRG